jgi:hypothetical protein
MNLLQNQSPPSSNNFQNPLYFIYPSISPNTTLLKAPEVPQLSTQSGPKNIRHA